ncbi:MAG: efflux RND transporter periplasmic adaptor subunit [Geobacteraceae bacterium]|nr:efflux RND transporter periplasmic adaptor subunit [Geobacteraceae bacterium]
MKRLWRGIACLVAVALLTGTWGCDKEKAVLPETHPAIKGIMVEKVVSTNIPARFEVTGTVRARSSATLSARIPGAVSKILVKEGDRVQRGRLLATLDAMESTAGAAGAVYAVDEALARKKLADVTYERFSRLYDEQAVTRQELDTRRAERDMADRALARARETARASGAVAGYTKIVAPLSGIVSGKSVDVGATVFPGMPLITIEEEGHYRLEAGAPESLLGKVGIGQEVPVSLGGIDGQIIGRVAEIVPKVDPVSRTFLVKLDILPKGVRSGQFGRAYFTVGEKKGLTVPVSAIVERGQLTSAWVVDSRNIARMRLVKPGGTYGKRIEILAGLSGGDRIITGGQEKVTEGARIE